MIHETLEQLIKILYKLEKYIFVQLLSRPMIIIVLMREHL